MAKQRTRTARRTKKNIPSGLVFIQATFNNTIVTVTDAAGNTISWSSAGVKGFKPIPDFVSDKVVLKELTIMGVIGVTRTGYASAIRLLEKRRHPVEMMHTHDFALKDAELAVKMLARQIEGEERAEREV